jgi:hypothetical protein
MPTPNFIKYSTTPDSSGIKVGNYTIGVFSGGTYGPTSTTNYWNGITPPISGYTIYENKAANGPSIRVAADASVLIDYTRRLYSGSSVTTEYSALTYLNSLGTVACVNRDYEEIITSGLTLNLDAGFTPSYPKSGTTWTDISFSGNNGTLTNGPTYNTSNGGSIVFDGVDDYLKTPSIINFRSICLWVSKQSTGTNWQYLLDARPGYSDGYFANNSTGGWSNWYLNGNSISSTWALLPTDQWFHLYIQANTNYTSTINFMSRVSNNENLGGKIGSIQIYNRPITPQEVLQNYQAQFPRFLGKNIVMNGLVNYLDAGYNVSYPGTGTTWNNISGVSGGTGTLTNGPTYSTDGGGSIVFDGVDDIINITDNPSLDISNNISISLWFNPSTYTSSVYSVNFFKKFEGISNANFQFYFDGVYTPQKIRVLATRGGTWDSVSPDSAVIGINQWTNVVWTYSSTGGGLLYINGVSQGNSVGSGVLSTNNTNIQIGQSLNGKISSSSIYNKVLTPQEVLQNYQAQLPTIVGENFITNGLVLYLDAKYKTSYPGTGTTWNNVSGVSGGTNTLVNGPVYSGTSGGTITFDGVDDYADFNAPNLGTTTTVEMWCKIGSGYSNKMFFGWNLYDVYCESGNIGYNTSNSDVYGISSSVVSSLGLVNNWKHYVFEMRSGVSYTNNKIYINGVPQTLSQQLGSENVSRTNFNNGNGRIALWRATNSIYNMPMECAVFKVYNRALTQNEINQNFNATKSRFGL